MTPPPDPADLPGPWPDVLAAYADGELDERARTAVEGWLAANPAAQPCADAQRRLSPENWQLWRDAAPPRPFPAAWDAVRDGIAVKLAAARLAEQSPASVATSVRLRRVVAVAAYTLTACVVLFPLLGPYALYPRGTQHVVERRDLPPVEDPLAGIPRLVIATDADVDVRRVLGAGAGGWLPVGGMPLTGPLALATGDDVEVEEAEEHPAWPMGGPRVRRDPADAPLLFPGANR